MCTESRRTCSYCSASYITLSLNFFSSVLSTLSLRSEYCNTPMLQTYCTVYNHCIANNSQMAVWSTSSSSVTPTTVICYISMSDTRLTKRFISLALFLGSPPCKQQKLGGGLGRRLSSSSLQISLYFIIKLYYIPSKLTI